jgi:hypothetical protein
VLQVFTRDGQLAGIVGGHGNLLGQFSELSSVYIDKNNRAFTSEQYPGRVQMFRYVTDAEADKLKQEKDAEKTARGGEKAAVQTPVTPLAPPVTPAAPQPTTAKTQAPK